MGTSKKRTQIIEAAKGLFTRYGFKRVTIEEICREASASKVTYYKYFRNKLELATAIRDDMLDSAFAAFDEIGALDIPFAEKIDRMTQWQLEFLAKTDNDFFHEMLAISDFRQEYRNRFLRNLESGRKTGEIRQDISLELVYLITEKLREIDADGSWKLVTQDYPEYVRQLRAVLFFGLLSRTDDEPGTGSAGV